MNNKVNIATRDEKDFLFITIERSGCGLEFKIYKDVEMRKLCKGVEFVAEFTIDNYIEINRKDFHFLATYTDHFYVNIGGSSYRTEDFATDLQIKTRDNNEILIYYFVTDEKFYSIIKEGGEYINYVDRYSTVKSAKTFPNKLNNYFPI